MYEGPSQGVLDDGPMTLGFLLGRQIDRILGHIGEPMSKPNLKPNHWSRVISYEIYALWELSRVHTKETANDSLPGRLKDEYGEMQDIPLEKWLGEFGRIIQTVSPVVMGKEKILYDLVSMLEHAQEGQGDAPE